MYHWLRHGLFRLEPEKAHDLAMASLDVGARFNLLKTLYPPPQDCPVDCMGLRFKNPVGLAAGLDKDGDHIDALGSLGFGFIEVGTVTPKPQPGNERPRMFRLACHGALINRMGFNNQGVDHLVENLKKRRYTGIVGTNVGKQKDTPIDQAASDYAICIEKVFGHCDYITINISSPNTKNLRALQDQGHLAELLSELVGVRNSLAEKHQTQRPMLIKIAPDWEEAALIQALETIGASGTDGLIATNTTLDRQAVKDHPLAHETGGLSGRPVTQASNHVLAMARQILGPEFPLVGVGGIASGADAAKKHQLGADLVQIYTGLIYEGPKLIKECVTAWPETR